MSTNARPEIRHSFRTERPTNLKLSTQMEFEDTYYRQTRSKVKVVMARGASDLCWPINREWKVSETPKLLESLPTSSRAIMRTSLIQGQKIKDQSHRAINAESGNESYLSNWKVYELQIWYTVGARRAVYTGSAITSKVEGHGSEVTWSVDRC